MFIWTGVGWGGAITSLALPAALRVLRMLRWSAHVYLDGVGSVWGNNVTCIASCIACSTDATLISTCLSGWGGVGWGNNVTCIACSTDATLISTCLSGWGGVVWGNNVTCIVCSTDATLISTCSSGWGGVGWGNNVTCIASCIACSTDATLISTCLSGWGGVGWGNNVTCIACSTDATLISTCLSGKQKKQGKKQKKKQNKCKKSKTNGPSVGSSLGKWASTCPKSSVWDLGWGAVPTTNPFLKIYVPIQVVMQGQKPKPNWNSFLHILHVSEANSRTGMHESQATETAHPTRPLYKCESSGCPKAFSAFAILYLQYTVFFIFDFYLFCIAFLHLHCLCIYVFLSCMFFLQLLFVYIFKIHFFHYMLHFFKIPIF